LEIGPLLAFARGKFCIPARVNSNLRLAIGSLWWAEFASYLGGTIVMLVVALTLREPFPRVAMASRSHAMSWIGGLFGAIYIAISILMLPRLGDRNRAARCRSDDRLTGIRSSWAVRLAGASHYSSARSGCRARAGRSYSCAILCARSRRESRDCAQPSLFLL